MIDPISLTVAGAGAGGTWGVAYGLAKRKGMSHSDAVKHACKVTKKTVGFAYSFVAVATSGDISGIIDSVFNS